MSAAAVVPPRNKATTTTTTTSPTISLLESRARSLLVSSIRTIGSSSGSSTSTSAGSNDNSKFVYPASCNTIGNDGDNGGMVLIESTTTLQTSRIFSKLGRSDLAWDFLRTLFVGQGENGFLPRFVYLNRTEIIGSSTGSTNTAGVINTDWNYNAVVQEKGSSAWEEFIGPYPGPKLFPAAPEGYVPQSYTIAGGTTKKAHNHYHRQNDDQQHNSEAKINVWSSNTIMASPYHATSILEVFYLSNQTDADVENLKYFYFKLLKWHDHLHTRIISNCSSPLSSTGSVVTRDDDANKHHPNANVVQHQHYCLTVNHPWETEIEMNSLLWEHALENVTRIVAAEGWTPNFEIPAAVKNSYDYPGDEMYTSLLYLLHCMSDHVESIDDDDDDDDDSNNKKHSSRHTSSSTTTKTSNEKNNNFHLACPFQMVDVGFTSAFSKSNTDLARIGKILEDKNLQNHIIGAEVATSVVRSHLSKRMLHDLYDDDKGTFFNAMMNLTVSNSNNGTTTSYYYTSDNNNTTPIKLPLGSNFLGFWDALSNETMVDRMVSHLIRKEGEFSFYCDDYPLWSLGGCTENLGSSSGAASVGGSYSPSILFLLNYRVSKGLHRNRELGLGHFLQSSTLNLICGLPNSDDHADLNINDCLDSQQFAMAFDATSHLPLGKDECGLTSTLTAAIVLDMLIPDKAFRYDSEPPISSSSVIFLIAVEMVVAFGIGIVCLLLSLNLMRRAKADGEGDDFSLIVREQWEEEAVEEELLLVQSPVEDNHASETVATNRDDEMGVSETGLWPVGLISRVNFWRRDTQ